MTGPVQQTSYAPLTPINAFFVVHSNTVIYWHLLRLCNTYFKKYHITRYWLLLFKQTATSYYHWNVGFEPLFIITINKNRLLVWHWKYCKALSLALLQESAKCGAMYFADSRTGPTDSLTYLKTNYLGIIHFFQDRKHHYRATAADKVPLYKL